MTTVRVKFMGLAAAGLASIAMATSASAQNWNGFYAGASIGAARAMIDVGTTTCGGGAVGAACGYYSAANANTINNGASGSVKGSVFTGGLQAGYNVQSGGFVYGIEVDVNSLKISAGQTARFSNGLTGIDLAEKVDTKYIATLRPRIGYASGSMLYYVTGGLAMSNVKHSYSTNEFGFGPAGSCSATGNYCGSGSASTRMGWTLGAGLEWQFAKNWSLKGEYLYTDLGSTSGSSNLSIGSPTAQKQNFDHAADLSMHTIRTGVNYKF